MNTSSTTEPIALPILVRIVDALAELRLLEVIYGYANGKDCKVVAIANELSGVQRDAIWGINLEFQRNHPNIDINVRIIQRRGQELAEVFEDDGTAKITRVLIPA